MATRQYDIARTDEKYEIGSSVGGVIADAIRVTVEEATPRNEILIMLEELTKRVLEDTWGQN